jgi:hypothetical protein
MLWPLDYHYGLLQGRCDYCPAGNGKVAIAVFGHEAHPNLSHWFKNSGIVVKVCERHLVEQPWWRDEAR